MDERWDTIVAALPGAGVFQCSGWARYGRALYRARTIALLARDATGVPSGALLAWVVPHGIERVLDSPLAPIAGPVLRVRRRDVRWADGPIAAEDATARALLREGIRCAQVERARFVDAWSAPPGSGALAPEWPSDEACTPVVDLTAPVEELWAGLDTSARKAVRKAQRDGLRIEVATDAEQLRRHHSFYAACRRERRLGAYGFRVARVLWEELGRGPDANVRSLAVLRGDEMLAVMTVWSFAGYVQEAALGQSRASVEQRTRAADLLKWWTIETFARSGAHAYDLAGIDQTAEGHAQGIARFKSKWGARIVCRPRYRPISLERAAELVGP